MSLKPTQEQVSEWIRTTQLEPHSGGWNREQRIAELAAAWGAEQAQQTTFVPPTKSFIRIVKAAIDLIAACEERHDQPPPLKYAIPYGAVNALRTAISPGDMDQVTAAQQTTVEEPELPEAVAWANAHSLKVAETGRARGGPYDLHTWSECRTTHHEVALYIAAQMHTYADAKVRAAGRQWRTIGSAPKNGAN